MAIVFRWLLFLYDMAQRKEPRIGILPVLATHTASIRADLTILCRDPRCSPVPHKVALHGMDLVPHTDANTVGYMKLESKPYRTFFLPIPSVNGKLQWKTQNLVIYPCHVYLPQRETLRQHIQLNLRKGQPLPHPHMQIIRQKGPDLFDMSWLLEDEVSDSDEEFGSADDPPCLMIPAKGGVTIAIFVQPVQTPPFSYQNFLHIFQTLDRVPDLLRRVGRPRASDAGGNSLKTLSPLG